MKINRKFFWAVPRWAAPRWVARCLLISLMLVLIAFAESSAVFQNRSTAKTKRILVLFKGSEGFTEKTNLVQQHIHKQLQRKRYQIDYHDIETQYPETNKLKSYGAIVTWFTSSIMKNPEKYLDWLVQQIVAGRKIVIIDNMGAYSPDGNTWLTENVLNRFYLPFGLEFKGQWTDKPALLEIVKSDQRFVGKQLPISNKKLNNYFKIKSVNLKNKSYLVVNRKDIADGESHLIVQTPFGGMALQNYVYEFVNGQQKFFLDVAKFVTNCLARPISTTDLPQKKVLALLKKSENKSSSESFIHRFAFKPLLELGYSTTYHFVEDGFPDKQAMNSYATVITWFQTPDMLDGENYVNWLLDQIINGRKIIILGNFGAFKATRKVTSPQSEDLVIDWWITWPKLNNFFYPFGLEFLGGWFGNPDILQFKYKDPQIVEKDIPLEKSDLTHYYTWKSVNPANKVFLDVERSDQPNSNSALILRTPYGGMAFEGYLMKWDATQNRLNFRLNLPGFLKECLTYRSHTIPKPIPLITHREILKKEREQKPKISTQSPASAPVIPAGSSEIKRWVMALYDGAENDDLDQNSIRTRVEVILNHLGLVVEHWDLRKGLPDPVKMEKFRGVITWFHDPVMKQPEQYASWLQEQIHANRKVVILGDYGAFYDQENELPANGVKDFFKAMGLRYWDVKVQPSKKQKIILKSPEMIDFEAPVDFKEMRPLETKITSDNPKNKLFLSIKDSRIGQIDAVVVTPAGGIALDESPFKEGLKDKAWMANLNAVLKGKGDMEMAENEPIGFWRINPFLFFTEAFGLKNMPIPDVTTLNGSRIFYSHIDGDGLTGISLIDLKSYASEFVRDQILKPYPLPISASVITKEIETKGLPYYNRGYMVARSIFELENIEPSTHSYTHPYDWRQGDMDARLVGDKWEWEVQEIDYDMEVPASIRFIEKNLVSPDKKVNLYLWSGRCNPDDRALRRIDENGINNLNGGDPIFDARFPSYSTLCPRATNINGFWQYHTSASNDFIYTKGWTRNFDHMAKLADHFDRTESPIRIMPLNIYIHFYIGDRQAGLDGLKKAYDYCVNHQIAPLFASEYVSIMKDFIGLSQYILPDGGFEIFHKNALRTIRFDNIGMQHHSQYPDLQRSQGIIGYLNYQNSLYVHLNENQKQTIYLQSTEPSEVYLKYGSHYTEKWQATSEKVSFNIRGLGVGTFAIANLTPEAIYSLSIKKMSSQSTDSQIIKDESVRTDNNGELKFKATFVGYQGRYLISIKKSGA